MSRWPLLLPSSVIYKRCQIASLLPKSGTVPSSTCIVQPNKAFHLFKNMCLVLRTRLEGDDHRASGFKLVDHLPRRFNLTTYPLSRLHSPRPSSLHNSRQSTRSARLRCRIPHCRSSRCRHSRCHRLCCRRPH